MKDFGELKIAPTSLDGKKNFKGSKISPRELDKQPFILVDFERELIPRRETEEYQRRLQDADLKGLNPASCKSPSPNIYAKSYIVAHFARCGPATVNCGAYLNSLKKTMNCHASCR